MVALLSWCHKEQGDSRVSIHPSPAPCPLQAAQQSKEAGLPLAQLKTPAQGNTLLPATEGRLPAVAKKKKAHQPGILLRRKPSAALLLR